MLSADTCSLLAYDVPPSPTGERLYLQHAACHYRPKQPPGSTKPVIRLPLYVWLREKHTIIFALHKNINVFNLSFVKQNIKHTWRCICIFIFVSAVEETTAELTELRFNFGIYIWKSLTIIQLNRTSKTRWGGTQYFSLIYYHHTFWHTYTHTLSAVAVHPFALTFVPCSHVVLLTHAGLVVRRCWTVKC